MLSVFSYNIWYGKKLKKIQDWLLHESPNYDIYCFQEFPQSYIEPFVAALSKKRTFVYYFSHGFTKPKGTFGQLTLYNAKKVKLMSSEIIQLGEPTLFEKKILRIQGERSALVTEFSSAEGTFTLVNAHLTAITTNNKRRKQLNILLGHLVENLSAGACVIVGDFNYTSLYRQKKLLHLMQSFGLRSALNQHTHRLLFIKHQLDYVFYTHCHIQDITVHKEDYSDHLPISFQLSLY